MVLEPRQCLTYVSSTQWHLLPMVLVPETMPVYPRQCQCTRDNGSVPETMQGYAMVPETVQGFSVRALPYNACRLLA